MKFPLMTKRPELATCYPEDADEHANLLMRDFDAVDFWLQQNQGQYLETEIKRNIALGVKQGVASGLEEDSYGIRKVVDEAFVQEVVNREISKELTEGLGLGAPQLLFDQLYKSYEELYAKLGAKYESARGYNLRLHQRLPKRLPRANITPYASRIVSDKHARQDGEQALSSDDDGTRREPSEGSEGSKNTPQMSEEQKEGSSDRCCMCGTIASQEELTTTMCCSQFVGSICFEEALQETGKCCLCHKTQSHFESGTSIGQSEQEPNYKFHFVETQSQAEDSRKNNSITGTFDQLETGATGEGLSSSLVPKKSAEPLQCPTEFSEWEARRPESRKLVVPEKSAEPLQCPKKFSEFEARRPESRKLVVPRKSAEPLQCPTEFSEWEARRPESRKLVVPEKSAEPLQCPKKFSEFEARRPESRKLVVPRKSAEPLQCPTEFSEWEARRPEPRKLEDKLLHGTGSFSIVYPEPSKFSLEDLSTQRKMQRLDPLEKNPVTSSITKEYEFVLRLLDQAVSSYLKHLSQDDVSATVSEALEKRLSATIHTTSVFGVLLLESGDIQFKYRAKKSRGPDLEGGAASLAETLEIFVRARLKPYLVVMYNIEMKSMNLCNQVQRTRVIEELVGLSTHDMQYLSRPDDVRTIHWTTDEKRRRTIETDSVTLGLATAAQANEVIAHGLIWQKRRRCCVKHVSKQNIVQCYNCQKFGHVGKTCTFSPRCRACAGSHQSRKCSLGLNASPRSLKCALCGGPHSANYYFCPVRSGKEIRLQTESRFYPTGADSGPAASATS